MKHSSLVGRKILLQNMGLSRSGVLHYGQEVAVIVGVAQQGHELILRFAAPVSITPVDFDKRPRNAIAVIINAGNTGVSTVGALQLDGPPNAHDLKVKVELVP